MIPIIDTINANAVNTTMTVSYVVIAHHLRFSDFPKTSRNVNFEGLRTFVITTKDNHLPYTAVPFMIITYHIFPNYNFRQVYPYLKTIINEVSTGGAIAPPNKTS
jgi:hypothetical protein